MPGVVAACLIVFIPTIGDYVTPRLVGGPDGAMIATMIQTQFMRLNNAPLGRRARRRRDGHGRARRARLRGAQPPVPRGAGRRVRGGWLGAYAALYLVFLYAPIALLPLFAFNDSAVVAFPLQGFTTRWFAELATVGALHDAAINSAIIAVVTALLSTTLGVCAARAGTRHRFPGRGPILGAIMLPLVLPEIIVAVALLVVFVQAGLPLSMLTVIAGHVLICTPFAIAVLNGAFQNLDPAMEEAARDLGETRASAFRLVTLPLVAPGIVSALLISFTISLDEFIIAFFLSGRDPTLPVYLWGQLRFPQRIPVVMALGTVLVLLSVVLIAAAETLRRRGLARAGLADRGGFL